MKFIADNMLGRLATWLRLLGYDTLYMPRAEDAELARIARAEDRILLTRDVELTRRRGLRFVLIESEMIEGQLQQLARDLRLTAQLAFSRCAVCNIVLEEAGGEQVRERVPPYVFQTQNQFRRCPRCGRVYWRGTHWARMVAQIQDALEP
ncbi:MAG: Mut7-C RNAse domain-containing protein [Chloroflexi bacterium]|nr:Mut7-C RNAse domain-containing protein [Chloroflexota bacterium]